MPFTLVSFHAHPDDEALLTAGTLARLTAEGHRVVLVVATAGEAGLTSQTLAGAAPLGATRTAELERSAAALGCARVVLLGYADSGMPDAPTGHPKAFTTADLDEAAERLARVLVEESADALTIYDPAGGYGHGDHIRVHDVGVRAAALAGTPVVLEATIDRRPLIRALRVLSWTRRMPPDFSPERFRRAYSSSDVVTHRVDVRRYTGQKRAAMQAHATQAAADSGDRTLAFCLRLPGPLYRRVFGHEWYVEHGRTPSRRRLDDVFATLRGQA